MDNQFSYDKWYFSTSFTIKDTQTERNDDSELNFFLPSDSENEARRWKNNISNVMQKKKNIKCNVAISFQIKSALFSYCPIYFPAEVVFKSHIRF